MGFAVGKMGWFCVGRLRESLLQGILGGFVPSDYGDLPNMG
jgi:hypothetical protein